MLFDWLGKPIYFTGCWVLSAVVLLVGAVAMSSRVRVKGAASWIIYLLVGPIGGLAAYPLIKLIGVEQYLLPVVAAAMFLSLLFIRFLLPSIAPDFQTENLSAAMGLALLIAVAVGAIGYTTRQVPQLIPSDLGSPLEEFPSNPEPESQ